MSWSITKSLSKVSSVSSWIWRIFRWIASSFSLWRSLILFSLLWRFCSRICDFRFGSFPCFNEKMDATLSRAFSNSSIVSPTVFLIVFKLSRNSSLALISWLNLWPDLIYRPFESNSALSSLVPFAFSSSILTFSFERSSMLFLIVVASWRFAQKFSYVNLTAAAGLSEVTKANLWFIAFKASRASHWRFLSVTKQRWKRSL